jgi:hypothetical protein
MDDMLIPGNIKPIFELCLNMSPWYRSSKESRIEALMQTVIAGNPKGKQNLTDLGSSFSTWILSMSGLGLRKSQFSARSIESIFQQLKDAEEPLTSHDKSLIPPVEEVVNVDLLYKQFLDGLSKDDTSWKEMMEVANAVDDVCRFYRQRLSSVTQLKALCLTSKGFLALVPQSTVIGDQIFLIQVARVPFALRRRSEDGYYTLIGECYVYGFMRGELLTDELEADIRSIQMI